MLIELVIQLVLGLTLKRYVEVHVDRLEVQPVPGQIGTVPA